MAFRIQNGIQEGSADEFQAVNDIIPFFNLDIDSLHDAGEIGLPGCRFRIYAAFFALLKEVFFCVLGDKEAGPDPFCNGLRVGIIALA